MNYEINVAVKTTQYPYGLHQYLIKLDCTQEQAIQACEEYKAAFPDKLVTLYAVQCSRMQVFGD